MIKALRSIFTKPPFSETVQSEIAKVYDPENQNDRIGLVLLVNIQNQLDLLGYEIGQVPDIEPFNSKKCRGSLYGLALGVMNCEQIPPDRDTFIDTLVAAFRLVFGHPLGADIAQQTDHDVSSGDVDVTWAADWSIKDLEGVYASGAATSWAAYYLAAKKMI
jgi:hypothetical protein